MDFIRLQPIELLHLTPLQSCYNKHNWNSCCRRGDISTGIRAMVRLFFTKKSDRTSVLPIVKQYKSKDMVSISYLNNKQTIQCNDDILTTNNPMRRRQSLPLPVIQSKVGLLHSRLDNFAMVFVNNTMTNVRKVRTDARTDHLSERHCKALVVYEYVTS